MADVVHLEIPSLAGHVGIARLVAAGVATAAGFDYEECEDLRIAVDECCVALLDGPGDGSLRLRFDVDPGPGANGTATIVVEGRRAVDGTPSAPSFDVLSSQILATIVDAYEVGAEDGDRWFRVVKSRPTAT